MFQHYDGSGIEVELIQLDEIFHRFTMWQCAEYTPRESRTGLQSVQRQTFEDDCGNVGDTCKI